MRTPESRAVSYVGTGIAQESSSVNLDLMENFLDKDPKIGVWSYPSYIVLQYLYHVKPGFKMSKIAKEALELGMRQLFPDLYSKAEELSRKKGLLK